VFDLAMNEEKFVMLYFHFDQCGACREMERTTLIDKEVMKFISDNFISYEINTRKGEGIEINETYKVRMHPAFIFLDPSGNELNKVIGMFSPEEFLSHAKNALDPEKTFAYYKKKYNSGNRDSDFMLEYCYRLNDANELDSLVINEYLNTLDPVDYNSEKNVRFIYEFMFHTHNVCIGYDNEAYGFMRNNQDIFASFFEAEQVISRLMIVVNNRIQNAVNNKNADEFWPLLEELKKYDGTDHQFKEIWGGITLWFTFKDHSLDAEIAFYKALGDEEKYHALYQTKVDKNWDDSEALNSLAWYVYLGDEDDFLLAKALECVIRSIELDINYNNTDTYAALLYKDKQYVEALVVAERAVEIAKKEDDNCDETLALIEKIKEQLE
jgi:tetratricopeptide (TPR) repeat protein